MCFLITAIGRAADNFHLPGQSELAVRLERKWFDKRVFVQISEEGGCACSLLSDEADWNEPVWRLRTEILPRLGSTLLLLHRAFAGSFEFEAIWIGDQIKDQQKISIDGLIQLVEDNRIANFTRYLVQP